MSTLILFLNLLIDSIYQVIQSDRDLFIPLIVGGHDSPLKGTYIIIPKSSPAELPGIDVFVNLNFL